SNDSVTKNTGTPVVPSAATVRTLTRGPAGWTCNGMGRSGNLYVVDRLSFSIYPYEGSVQTPPCKEVVMKRKHVLWVVLFGGLVPMAALAAVGAKAAPSPEATPEEMFKKAQVNGKYRMLLARIKVEGDAEKIKELKDDGFKNQPEYGGHKNLPAG